MMLDINNLAVHDNKLYIKSDNEFISGWNRIELQDSKPLCKFKGGKIDHKTWFQVLSFFLWTQEKYKSESQVRLYYNTQTRSWAAQPYPQSPSGMTTNDKQDEEIRAKFKDPWVYFGTAHHHCTTNAFQSGTDEANEKEQDGFHYTIGHLDKAILDYHGRFSWAGELFPADMLSWVEMPDWFDKIPTQVRYRAVHDYLLCTNVAKQKEHKFPEEWKDVVKEKPKTYNTHLGAGYYGGYGAYQASPSMFPTKQDKQEAKDEAEIEEILWQAGITPSEWCDVLEDIEDELGLHGVWRSDVTQACVERNMSFTEFNQKFQDIFYVQEKP